MKLKKITISSLFSVCLTIIVVILDFISKQWIINYFKLGKLVSLAPFLNIFYTQNYGVTFNFFTNKDGWKFWFLIIIQIILILTCFMIMYGSTVRERIKKIAWAFIIGGSLGNCLDRILHGFVVDFIDLTISAWHFPTFNIADSAICIGVILILIETP
ncbi:MAG: signal peptidase II [Candidatus Dasytiphilus stammeri]